MTRKKRPLTRDCQDFRDDRLFIVASDDTYAPDQYFNFFKMGRIKVHIIPATNGNSHASHALEALMEIECDDHDERWLLLDTDHCINSGTQAKSFMQTLQSARQQNVNIALSCSCFEVWLLLHHVDASELPALRNAKLTESKLKKVLGGYDKTRLNEENFSLSSLADAILRAQTLDKAVGGGDRPTGVTTRVYKLWLSIINGASKNQLPQLLHQFKT